MIPERLQVPYTHSRYTDAAHYQEECRQALDDTSGYFSGIAKELLVWDQPFRTSFAGDFSRGQVSWFADGRLNICRNAIDRHLPERAAQPALIWHGERDDSVTLTYQELAEKVCEMAAVLLSLGVQKGDRVTIYMPLIPELPVVLLAVLRIGAVHSVVFGGFSADSLRDRIMDAGSEYLITAESGFRAGKPLPIRSIAEHAVHNLELVKSVLVIPYPEIPVSGPDGRFVAYPDVVSRLTPDLRERALQCESMLAEDPAFLLYTSGSTGKPKGVMHTTAGYALYAAHTHRILFDPQAGDIHWCTADIGWITGHSYVLYGPLINGTTTFMYEGVPTWPDHTRCWELIDRYKITSFYTAPTAIRALMRFPQEDITKFRLDSLKLLGSVGEPINPEAWMWYFRNIGRERCPVIDTWWQTETGGVLISTIPGVTDMVPGSATLPLPGIQPVLLDDQGNEISGEAEGNLALRSPWPGIMRGVYGDPERFYNTYFSVFPGYYFTGDGARRNALGEFTITGRVDDVLNVSGHRLGTAEIESALVLHPAVAEAAVVGMPHDLKGQAVYAFVTLKEGHIGHDALKADLKSLVVQEIGALARPEHIQWSSGLPKTRSGKILRRILRKVAAFEFESLGDTSTLADPSVVELIVAGRKAMPDG